MILIILYTLAVTIVNYYRAPSQHIVADVLPICGAV